MAAKSNKAIAIVGAGVSGLRCADVLLQNGFQVAVFEGRDRVGGRVHQQLLENGHWVDMGPNWIHGTSGNIMLDMAEETETTAEDIMDISCVFDENGSRIPTEESTACETVMWNMIEEAFKYSAASGPHIDTQANIMDFFKEKIPLWIPETDPRAAEKRKTVFQLCESWGAFIGSPAAKQSLKFFWMEECIDGENLFCSGTYKKILQNVLKPVTDKINVSTNTVVKQITYGRSDERIKLELADGSFHEFDDVVVTAPLGWLQKNKSKAFQPQLPESLSVAIDSISYGCLEKVYISFPEPFWANETSEKETVNGFLQWISPNFDSKQNPHRWPQEAFEMSHLGGGNAHATLLFYTFGEQSRWFTSELAKTTNAEQKKKLICDYYRPYYSRLPNYDASSKSCEPTDCIATEWLNDDMAGNGSYGNFQVGLENGGENVKTMRHGIPELGLWLAGEHTAPYVALGTTTGAYLSGEAVAGRIVKKYEN